MVLLFHPNPMTEKTEGKGTRVGVAVAFAAIVLLALIMAASWYFLKGSKSDKAPGAPQSKLGVNEIHLTA
jgi:hypothetical protein